MVLVLSLECTENDLNTRATQEEQRSRTNCTGLLFAHCCAAKCIASKIRELRATISKLLMERRPLLLTVISPTRPAERVQRYPTASSTAIERCSLRVPLALQFMASTKDSRRGRQSPGVLRDSERSCRRSLTLGFRIRNRGHRRVRAGRTAGSGGAFSGLNGYLNRWQAPVCWAVSLVCSMR